MVNQRIKSITNAAALLFIQQGYSRTQISHIAKAVGVSVGTIYHDFTGKQEILHFFLKCVVDPGFMDLDFETPVTNEPFAGLNDEITAAFQRSARDFTRHLDNMDSSYTFEDLISDAYDILYQYAAGCLFIEKNQSDFKDLALSYREYRKTLFSAMADYLSFFIERGTVRPFDHPDLIANMIIEILSWWAMDRRFVSFEAWDIPSETAREVCLDNIITAYRA